MNASINKATILKILSNMMLLTWFSKFKHIVYSLNSNISNFIFSGNCTEFSFTFLRYFISPKRIAWCCFMLIGIFHPQVVKASQFVVVSQKFSEIKPSKFMLFQGGFDNIMSSFEIRLLPEFVVSFSEQSNFVSKFGSKFGASLKKFLFSNGVGAFSQKMVLPIKERNEQTATNSEWQEYVCQCRVCITENPKEKIEKSTEKESQSNDILWDGVIEVTGDHIYFIGMIFLAFTAGKALYTK